jgi:hypothetical protein
MKSTHSRPTEPPLRSPAIRVKAIRVKLVAIALLAACAASAQTLDPAAALAEAKAAFARGDYADALGVVRSMRIQTPGSRHLPEALLLAAQAALVSEPFRARFFLDQARSHPQTSDAIHFEVAVTAAELARRDRLLADSLDELQRALRLQPADIPGRRLDEVRIQAAELALYELNDLAAAAYLTLQVVQPTALEPADRRTYDRLVRDVLWSTITPAMLGLPDGNVTAISVDADDVWIGTSNGGVARYSQNTGIASRFTGATTGGELSDTIRAIEVDGNWVWLGTAEGLSVYSKATSRLWRVERFRVGGSGRPNVWALEGIDGSIAAGTLGQGLWLADDPDGEWTQVEDPNSLVRFVQALLRRGSTLYIGTLDRGVAAMDLETGRVRRVDRLWAAGAKNIHALSFDESGRLWVGDHGNGLFRWDPDSDEITRFTKGSGSLGDDFVLAATAAPGTVLFGTHGGGAYRYALNGGGWTHFDMTAVVDCPPRHGMGANEIRAVAQAGPFAYFGTQGCGVAVLADSLQYAADAASN